MSNGLILDSGSDSLTVAISSQSTGTALSLFNDPKLTTPVANPFTLTGRGEVFVAERVTAMVSVLDSGVEVATAEGAPLVYTFDGGRVSEIEVGKRPIRRSELSGTYQSAIVMAGPGIDPTGATASTAALQAKLDEADGKGSAIFWPAGTFLTGTLNYRAQSMHGAGRAGTIIRGLPAQDVFHFDTTLGSFAREACHLSGFRVVVDDSADAGLTFPQRSGVGNAGFAADYPNGNVQIPLRFHRAQIEDVEVRSLSFVVGGQNASCGVYLQTGLNLTSLAGLAIYRTKFGWWEDSPTSNVNLVEFFSDHNDLQSLYLNECGNAFRAVNWANCKVGDLIVHGGARGVIFDAVASQARNLNLEVQLGTVYIENVTVEPIKLVGRRFRIDNLAIAGPHGTVEIAASNSVLNNLNISTAGGANTPPVLRLTGDRNAIEMAVGGAGGSAADFVRDLVDDRGRGNRVVVRAFNDSPNNRQPQVISHDGRLLHDRDGTSLALGHVQPPFTSGADLLVGPSAIIPDDLAEGAGFTFLPDASAPLGSALRIPAPSNFFTTQLNGKNGLRVGPFLPATRVRVYVCAKLATAGTQTWGVISVPDGVDRGFATMSFGTSYTTSFFDINLSGLVPGQKLQVNANAIGGGAVGPLDLAFIAFRPFADSNLSTGPALLSNTGTPAGNPVSGGFLFVENGALKYKGSNGTVTTVALA